MTNIVPWMCNIFKNDLIYLKYLEIVNNYDYTINQCLHIVVVTKESGADYYSSARVVRIFDYR